MTTFVLVHGAWHGSWCWKRVRGLLQHRGHEVFTPTLTGIGERAHLLAPTIDLRTHTLDVLNLIQWEELDDIVLCGHSYGGMVVTGVADKIPRRIRTLLYLDAFVPENGESLVQFAPIAEAQLVEGWKCIPISAETFGVNAADRAWVDRQCTLQSVACFRQPADLTGGLSQLQRIGYVYAAGWAGSQSPFYPFYQKAKSRGWFTHEVNCGHDVMLDEPEVLAALLASL
jgi:pimeloyl-ACP methyl ester carboxylesterase